MYWTQLARKNSLGGFSLEVLPFNKLEDAIAYVKENEGDAVSAERTRVVDLRRQIHYANGRRIPQKSAEGIRLTNLADKRNEVARRQAVAAIYDGGDSISVLSRFSLIFRIGCVGTDYWSDAECDDYLSRHDGDGQSLPDDGPTGSRRWDVIMSSEQCDKYQS
jgi:hypothetical protein